MKKIEIEYVDGFEDVPISSKLSEKAYRVVNLENGQRNGEGKGYNLEKLFNLLQNEWVITINNGFLSLDKLKESERFTYPVGLESDLKNYKDLLDRAKETQQKFYAEKQAR
ncbi:hypothetical protein GOV13_03305 [Candidatus Pacearchaeota archaeon]|nr:hypothetical protein [Candidatus Pacearchaeota archaeon]